MKEQNQKKQHLVDVISEARSFTSGLVANFGKLINFNEKVLIGEDCAKMLQSSGFQTLYVALRSKYLTDQSNAKTEKDRLVCQLKVKVLERILMEMESACVEGFISLNLSEKELFDYFSNSGRERQVKVEGVKESDPGYE